MKKPKRGHGEGTFSKHATRDLWMGRLRIGDHRITVYGKTKADAREKLNKKRGELERQMAILGEIPEPRTLGYLFDTWLAAEEGHLSAKSLADYRLHAATVTQEIGAKTLIDRIAPSRIQTMLNAYRDRPRKALYLYQVLHRALEMAVKWGWLAVNHSDRVIRPKYKAEERAVWSQADACRFLEHAGRWRPLWLVALASGCRPGELRGLQWTDVDFDAGTITLRRSVTEVQGRDVISEGKTKLSRRTIALEPDAMAALRDWRKQQAEELLRLGVRNSAGWVWTSEDGSLARSTCVLSAFRRDLERAKLTGRPYDLRHWHASMMLADNEPVPNVSARLGHANPHITMQTYAHVIPRERTAPSFVRRIRTAPAEEKAAE